MALIMEDWTGAVPEANAYADVAIAGQILGERHLWDDEDWDAADSADQEKALIWTTALLDVYFAWDGVPLLPGVQPLGQPRHTIYDRDGLLMSAERVRKLVQWANAEFARHMLQGDRTIEDFRRGFASMDAGRAGGFTVDPATVPHTPPQSVIDMLMPIARLAVAKPGGFRVHRLIRA